MIARGSPLGRVHAAAAVVIVTACATVAACGSSPESNPEPGSTSSVSNDGSEASRTTLGADGAAIYAATCAGCHGPAGEGNLCPALTGIAERMPQDEQTAVVANGRGTMRAFSPALTDEQIAAVVAYTRTQLP